MSYPLTPETRDTMRRVALARAQAWELCAKLVAPPTYELAEAFLDGSLGVTLHACTSWISPSQDSTLVKLGRSLAALARQQAGRDPFEVQEELEDDYEGIEGSLYDLFPEGPDPDWDAALIELSERGGARRDPRPMTPFDTRETIPTIHGALAAMFDQFVMCHREAKAWEEDRLEDARALRASQHDLVEDILLPGMPDVCAVLQDETVHPLYEVAGWFILCHLSLESGRGFITDLG